jgi:hypothetical protein
MLFIWKTAKRSRFRLTFPPGGVFFPLLEGISPSIARLQQEYIKT